MKLLYIHKIVLIVIVISFLVLPRLPGGVRVEDIIIAIYCSLIMPWFLREKSIDKTIVTYFIFIIFSFFLSLYSDIIYSNLNYFNWITFFRYLLYFLIIILGYRSASINIFKDKTFNTVFFALVYINIFWMLYQSLTGNYRTLFGSGEAFSYGVNLLGEAAAFQVGSLLSLFIIILVLLIRSKKQYTVTFFIFVSIMFLFYFLYLVETRVVIFSTIILVCFLMLSRIRSRAKILLIFAIPILISFYYINNSYFTLENDNERLTTSGILNSYLTRSDGIWEQPLESVLENPIKINGLAALNTINSQTTEMHNYYLKILFEGGFFYFILFILFIIYTFKLGNKNKNKVLGFNITALLKSYLFVLLMSAFLQDSFSSNKAVYPFFFLVGYVSFLNKKADVKKLLE